MARLSITIATWDYDRVRPLMDGRVPVEGCDVNFIPLPPEECFHRVWKGHEFDVAEVGMGSYMNALGRGMSPYVAIPVFPSRQFRHSAIYVRADRGIERPEDLKGKAIGVPEYQAAACLWARGMLQDEYGLRPEDCQWHQGGMDDSGRDEKMPMNLPAGFPLRVIEKGDTLNRMFAEGRLDAMMCPRTPSAYLDRSAPVRRLFEDFPAAEKDYFRSTGVFPIMHALGIRQDVQERHPWLALSLLKAFEQAKRIALRDLFETAALKISLPWSVAAAQEARALIGDDFWPYGVAANRPTLDAMVRYSFEQHQSVRRLSVEELFAPTTLDAPKT